MRKIVAVLALIASLLAGQTVAASEITVLSAGAVEAGLRAAAAAYEKQTGRVVKTSFETSPQIRARIGAGETFDVVIVTPAILDEFVSASKVEKERVTLGRVGMGVAVRASAPSPDISSVEALMSSILAAEGLVITRGSSGVFFEGLLKKMGLYDQVESKLTRYDGGEPAFEHMAMAKDHELSFGQITEIRLYGGKGVRLVGPLPAEVQNYTSFAAAAMTGGPNGEAARDFVRYVGSPAGKALFAAAGVE